MPAALSPLTHRALRPSVALPAVHRLEVMVGLASFTGCMVAVDKLFLFYSCVFYKSMAVIDPDEWEPTLRYPKRLKRGAKYPKVLVQLPMFNETHVAARIIEYACKMEYPRERCAGRERRSACGRGYVRVRE